MYRRIWYEMCDACLTNAHWTTINSTIQHGNQRLKNGFRHRFSVAKCEKKAIDRMKTNSHSSSSTRNTNNNNNDHEKKNFHRLHFFAFGFYQYFSPFQYPTIPYPCSAVILYFFFFLFVLFLFIAFIVSAFQSFISA